MDHQTELNVPHKVTVSITDLKVVGQTIN